MSTFHFPFDLLEVMSEAVKLLKGEYVVRAIEQQKMDRAIIFCRTKLDCDNLEQHFIARGGGTLKLVPAFPPPVTLLVDFHLNTFIDSNDSQTGKRLRPI